MKHRIKSILIALSLSLSAVGMTHASLKTNFDGCTPAKTMYFSYTADHEKAVEWCDVPGGYRYTYGPINKPETQITKKPGEAGIIKTERGGYFAIRNNDLIYWTTTGRDGSDILVVSKGNWTDGHRRSIIYLEGGMGHTNNASKGYKAFDF